MGVWVPAIRVNVGEQVNVKGLYQQLKQGCGLRGSFVQVAATGRFRSRGSQWAGWVSGPRCGSVFMYMCTCVSTSLSCYRTFLIVYASGCEKHTKITRRGVQTDRWLQRKTEKENVSKMEYPITCYHSMPHFQVLLFQIFNFLIWTMQRWVYVSQGLGENSRSSWETIKGN